MVVSREKKVQLLVDPCLLVSWLILGAPNAGLFVALDSVLADRLFPSLQRLELPSLLKIRYNHESPSPLDSIPPPPLTPRWARARPSRYTTHTPPFVPSLSIQTLASSRLPHARHLTGSLAVSLAGARTHSNSPDSHALGLVYAPPPSMAWKSAENSGRRCGHPQPVFRRLERDGL
jgi:hypothetical protein